MGEYGRISRIIYRRIFCILACSVSFTQTVISVTTLMGPQTVLGLNLPVSVLPSTGPFSARTKREYSYSKPAYICLRSVSELNTLGEAQLVTLPFRNDIADVEAYRNKFKRCNYYVRSILGDTLH